jgi:1,4-dihydroxy-2-naphthoate octaprenyltransferase
MSTADQLTAAPQRNKLQIWGEEVRAPFFTAVLVPVILGSVIAWQHGYPLQIGYFFMTLIGAVLLHAGANVMNDYADHLNGCDERNTEFVRPFTGGSRMIQNGLLAPREVLTGSLIFLGLSTVIGLTLVGLRGMPILYLGLIGTFCAVFYTIPPFNLAARGIGELIVGLCFGTLMMLGAYYVQTQTFSTEVAVASIPVSLLIAAVLYINEFPDYIADRDSGKRHLVVRMGRPRAFYGYVAMMAMTYLAIIAGVALSIMPLFTLISLITLPKAFKAVKVAAVHHSDSQKLIPANAGTIQVHLMTGLLLSLGYVLAIIF